MDSGGGEVEVHELHIRPLFVPSEAKLAVRYILSRVIIFMVKSLVFILIVLGVYGQWDKFLEEDADDLAI